MNELIASGLLGKESSILKKKNYTKLMKLFMSIGNPLLKPECTDFL